MSILSFLFGKKEVSANIAKDRLQIIIAQERVKSQAPDYLPMLQKELMEVLAKYVHISLEDIKINHDTKDGVEVLELNITLPEEKLEDKSKKDNLASNTRPKSTARPVSDDKK